LTRGNLIAGLGWVALTILCWAPMFSVGKRALAVLDPFALATVRYGFGVLLLVLLLLAVEGAKSLRFDGRFAPAALYGLVGIAGFNLFVWVGLKFTLPEHASIILALQTPLTALGIWLVRGQRPGAFTLGCVMVAIFGVFLVVTKGDPLRALVDVAQGDALLGDVLVLLGGVSWVAYVLSAPHFTGWSPLRFSVLTCIPGFVGLAVANVFAIAAGWARLPTMAQFADTAWAMTYFAFCTVFLGILAFNNAVRRMGALNTMLMLNVTPVLVFGIEAGLGRSFAVIEILGAVVVVGALIANNLYLRGTSTRR
jgi:drug/metabolite transporter (DMT)-like permease